MAATDKLHRWLDLIASLLSRRFPASLAELKRDVPGYADGSVQEASLLRMFERDKDELRDLGVVIDTSVDSEGVGRYQLRRHEFYLPLLSVCEAMLPAEAEVRQQPSRLTAVGSSGVPSLVLTPDECHALRRAAARVSGLGHPELAADAERALRKLQFDLQELASALPATDVLRVDGDIFDTLSEAVALRKRLTFTYHSMERDDTATREVEPYGLVFLTGHWYLVANDRRVNDLRQFRVSRIRDAEMAKKPQHPDFDVPASFDLSAYAASRRAWELGNGDLETVIVAFRGDTGLVSQGRAIGDALSEAEAWAVAEAMCEATRDATRDALDGPRGDESADTHTLRSFRVRRRESFLRWLLSFAGDARPVSPVHVVGEWRALLQRTRAVHATPLTTTATIPATTRSTTRSTTPTHTELA